MRKSLHRIIALALTLIIAMSELTVPVYATEINEEAGEQIVQPEEVLPEDETDDESDELGKAKEETEDKEPEAGENAQLMVDSRTEENDDALLEDTEESSEQFVTGYNYILGEGDVESIAEFADDADDSLLGLNFADELPDYYITDNLPPLRNQGHYGTCWAHSNMATAEISMMKQGYASDPDYSELHLAFFTYNTPTDPTGRMAGDKNYGIYDNDSPNYLQRGGNHEFSSKVLASWVGAADESTAPYSSASSVLSTGLSDDIAFSDVAHLKNYYKVSTTTDDDRAAIKRMVRDLGAAGVSYYALQSGKGVSVGDETVWYTDAYNSSYNCYYFPASINSTNHAVTIVGWDDNFSKENFSVTPEGDGAWLIRNSWDSGDISNESYTGYFWMSYYDKSLAQSAAWGYEFESADNYDHNYQYDGGMDTYYPYKFSNTVREANVFEIPDNDSDQVLSAVSFDTYKNTNVDYKIDIYLNPTDADNPSSGDIVSTVEGTTSYAGYYTVALDSEVPLQAGDKFSVVVTLSKTGKEVYVATEFDTTSTWYKTSVTALEGQSFISQMYTYISGDGSTGGKWGAWQDVSKTEGVGNVRIKAFTKDDNGSKYTVTLEANGGKFDSGVLIKTKKYGDGKQYGTLPEPKRDGYDFSGWYTAVDGGSKIESTDTVTDNITLYAHWTGKKYSVILDANGGKFGSVSTKTVQATYGETYGNLINEEPTRAGYSFAGWYSDANTGSEITEASIVDRMVNHTLYAHWTALTYAVAFDPTGGNCDTPSITVTYDTAVGSLPIPTRLGYKFDGWYTEKVGGKEIVSATIATFTQNTTLYAHWIADDVLVQFDPNGGICQTEFKYVTYGSSYGELPVPTRAGYDFLGWYTAATGGSIVNSDTVVTATGKYKVYARWKEKSITVTFDAQGGNCSKESISVTYNGTYGTLPVATRTGYKFEGWYMPNTDMKIESSTIVYLETAHTLVARWTANTYVVTLNLMGGTCSETSVTVTYDRNYPDLPIPTKTGYIFDGWYTDSTGGTKVTSSTIVSTANPHTLWAHWNETPVYHVTFAANISGVTDKDIIKSYEEKSQLGELPAGPERNGYEFVGWYTAESGGTKVTSSMIVTADVTYYAHWKPGKVVVTYNANGGSCNVGTKEVTLLGKYGSLPTASRTGYRFSGWYTEALDGTSVTAATIVTNESAHTLYAHWIPNTYLLTFDATGGMSSETARTVTYEKSYAYLTDGTTKALPTPVKSGYDFAGWFRDQSGVENVTDESTVNIAAAHRIYAKWTPIEYDITLDPDRGKIGDIPGPQTIKLKYGEVYGELPVPTPEGTEEAFIGWYIGEDKGIRVSASTKVNEASDHTLYARYEDWGEVLDEEGKKDRDGKTVGDFAGDDIQLFGVPDEAAYSGIAVKFDDLRLYRGNRLLVKDKDYSISYSRNTNAGTAIVTVSGKGNYSGKITREVTITPCSFDGGKATAHDISLTENGKIQKGIPVVTYTFDDGRTVTLKNGKDYVCDYTGVKAEQDNYPITVKGIGNYTGSLTCNEIILPKADAAKMISKATVKSIPAQQATGGPIEFTGENAGKLVVSVKDGKDTIPLVQGVHYETEYYNNILPGTATLIIKGKDDYTGTKTVSFKINAVSINKATITGVTEGKYEYTGAAITPVPALSYTAKKGEMPRALEPWNGSNPTGSFAVGGYSNNINAGKKASITIIGKGDFTGTVKKSFTIDPVDIANESKVSVKLLTDVAPALSGSVTVGSQTLNIFEYQKAGTKPALSVTFHGKNSSGANQDYRLVQGVDYTVSYKNNKAVTTSGTNINKLPTVTIKGKGNFKGKVELHFAVGNADISKLTMTAEDVVYKNKTGVAGAKITIVDASGTKLGRGEYDAKSVKYVYSDVPDGADVVDKNHTVVDIEENTTEVDLKNHIVPAGTVITVSVKGKGMYSGTISADYRVASANISSAVVKIYDRYFTGNRIYIGYDDIKSIAMGRTALEPGDYEIVNSYANIKKGTAKAVIKGRGNYGGSKTVTFKIINKPLNK